MRAHVVDIARYRTGEVAEGKTLTVYRDESMTDLATLYPARSGATTTANPVVIPANGLVDFWCDDSAPYGLAEGETVAYPLMVLDKTGIINVCDFGAVGDNVHDDTDAFVAARNLQRTIALENWPDIGHNELYAGAPPVYVPSGHYVVQPGNLVFDYRHAHWYGDGPGATIITSADDTDEPLFQFGDPVVDMAPTGAELWGTSAFTSGQGSSLRKMSLLGYGGQTSWTWVPKNDGPRTGIAILDNASGSMVLEELAVWGWKYGFCTPYGHDFCYHKQCDYIANDVGMYFGVGSEQVKVDRCSMQINVNNLILEGAVCLQFDGCQIMSPHERDIWIRYIHDGGTTYYGVTASGWESATHDIIFDNLWSERVWGITPAGSDLEVSTLPGGYRLLDPGDPDYDADDPASWVFIDGDHANYNIVFNEPMISMYIDPGSTRSEESGWLELGDGQAGCYVEINNPQFVHGGKVGGAISHLFKCDNANVTYANVRIHNPWYNGVGWPPDDATQFGLITPGTDIPVGTVITHQGWGEGAAGHMSHGHSWSSRILLGAGSTINDVSGTSIWGGNGGYLRFGWHNGAAETNLHTMGIDLLNARLLYGELDGMTTYRGVGVNPNGNSAPIAGTWQVGDILYNATPTAGGWLGWVCVGAGTPGTWQEFGAIDNT